MIYSTKCLNRKRSKRVGKMNELIFIQYTFYLLGIFALIKLLISEVEDIIIRFKKLKTKLRKISQ